ncbi:5-amino-6-(5-phosphoribosylamino)uracil reductase [Tolypocladium capitatum]|uniref:2,5-diamino-6-ribosylamino-4(3H)-pyrimidinone 5'-phosphate reductase n=1 Tax=Tolypocladium capitatum TaxID=45235 RepID=A0A2K3QPD0_9HYPO|nr:5-amino-6-(5-phosphoribosylamino)uracil reductase [Tolypocladium capitatum]
MKSLPTWPKRKASPEPEPGPGDGDEPTEVKLALLSSLHATVDQETLLDILLAHEGSVSEASAALQASRHSGRKSSVIGYQQSLKQYALPSDTTSPTKKKPKLKKGSTLHLYDPDDVAEHTPCTIIHNFLPPEEADDLLRELLDEAKSFEKITFKLFDNVVSSPHTSGFFVESYDAVQAQKADYYYNGSKLTASLPLDDVRRITPQLTRVKPVVQEAVNREIKHRIKTRYPGGKKLQHQSPNPWVPNSAFVNCYNGAQEGVGWHSDQLTYLGPRAVIGSISLGVAREFRVRRVLPWDGDARRDLDRDAEGQMSIHLPHNSLLVMHAEMQEEWKHCIAPAPSIDPHPVAGVRRINITYRDYRQRMHPSFTPRCGCGVPFADTSTTGNLGAAEGPNPRHSLAPHHACPMAEQLAFPAASAALLEPHLPPDASSAAPRRRPFVTLTFATSLDSTLSLAPGVRTSLSGPGSKAMTHYLRSRHAAILVGVSTVLADDPALNCRIAGAEARQPRPVVVDPHLRWTPRRGDKVFEVFRGGVGLAPFVLTGVDAGEMPPESVRLLEEHGGKYIHVPSARTGAEGRMRFDWRDVLDALSAEGLSSVMVEGGGQVINSLLDPACHVLVDSVIVTIAPTWLGQGGVVVSPDRAKDDQGRPVPAARLSKVSWHPFGEDVVLCGKLQG